MPRPPHGFGWLSPAQAAVEMMQCMSQAVPISARKAQGKAQQHVAALLQLPGIGQEALKVLRRQKVRCCGWGQGLRGMCDAAGATRQGCACWGWARVLVGRPAAAGALAWVPAAGAGALGVCWALRRCCLPARLPFNPAR
jgi:hypothetical protein